MSKIKLALAQIKTSKDYKENLAKILNYMHEAKKFGAELVVFPEMAMAFIPSNEGVNFASVAQGLDEEFVSSILKTSKDLEIAVVFGFFERTDDTKRAKNSVIYAENGKVVYKYSKTHLYDAFSYDESKDIIAGEEKIKAFDTKWGKMGIMVCYELRFPEIARTLTLQGAELILVPTAWVGGNYKDEHLMTLTKSRALENTVFLCTSNQTGNIFTGRSSVINPLGLEICKLGVNDDMQVCEIDFNEIKKVREVLPCVMQRKPESYSI